MVIGGFLMKISADSGGVKLEADGRKIGLDTREECDLNFISHAHSDHVSRSVKRVVCSDGTASIVAGRYGLEFRRERPEGFELVPSGHILGSTALLIHSDSGRILYTGDFCTRDRLFIKGFRPPKAEVLILETTFGSQKYVFPDTKQTIKESLSWMSSQLNSGRSVTALGYSLGKAQLLCAMVEDLGFPVYVHGAVLKMNSLYSHLGVELHGFVPYTEAKAKGYLSNGPYVMVSPQTLPVNTMNARFTGWAMDGMTGADAAFPLSDHAGFDELLQTVRKVNPNIVLTTHGFSENFARILGEEGYRAIPLASHQMRLSEFT